MSQENSNENAATIAALKQLNKVEGFDPSEFAETEIDKETGKVRQHLSVAVQTAWFRLKYPEGRISVTAVLNGENCIATARIFPNYKDGENEFLAEATAMCCVTEENLSGSPADCAQRKAVSAALLNAGFGLQFTIGGIGMGTASIKTDERTDTASVESVITEHSVNVKAESVVSSKPVVELTPEEQYRLALKCPCPINKYKDKTLGDLVKIDPKALAWIAEKFTGNNEIQAAAITICEYAKNQAAT